MLSMISSSRSVFARGRLARAPSRVLMWARRGLAAGAAGAEGGGGKEHPRTAEEGLRDCESIVNVDVRWGDMDAFQHVNNVHYIRYFEVARIHHFRSLGRAWEDMQEAGEASDFDMARFLRAKEVGLIVSNATARYLAPVTWPDSLLVGSTIEDLREDRFLQRYTMWSRKAQRIVARGDADIVMFDYQKNSKTAVPEAIVQAIDHLKATPRPHRARLLAQAWDPLDD